MFNSNFQIAVNLSPRQFRDPPLLTFIIDSLKKYHISPDTLELEITKGLLLSGHSYVDNILTELNNQGMARDNFGTDYSSLSSLRT